MAWEMKYQPNVVLDFDGVIHSYVSGGHGGGVVAGAYAILERRDGTVGLAEAQRVQFLDTAKEFAKYEEEETKDV